MSSSTARSRKFRKPLPAILIFALVTAATFALAAGQKIAQVAPGIEKTAGNYRTVPVRRGIVSLEIAERGTVEPVKSHDVICTLKSRNKSLGSTVAATIKWLVEDGSSVKKGDKVIEFDDSSLRDEM